MLTYLGWLDFINTLINPACGESRHKQLESLGKYNIRDW